MVRVARTIRDHLFGIVNAVMHRANNGAAEGINSVIQKLEGRAHGPATGSASACGLDVGLFGA
jgi:transposase